MYVKDIISSLVRKTLQAGLKNTDTTDFRDPLTLHVGASSLTC